MQLFYLQEELSWFDYIIIEFVQLGCRSKFWPWNMRERTEMRAVYNQRGHVYKIEKDKNHENCVSVYRNTSIGEKTHFERLRTLEIEDE